MQRISWYRQALYWLASFWRPHQRGPVKRLFSLGFITLLGTGALALAQLTTSNQNVLFFKAPDVVVVNESFTVDVMVAVDDEINAVDLKIAYPQNRFTVTNLRDGQSVLNIWTESPAAEDGLLTLSGGTFRRGFTGEHRVISLRGIATQAGQITLDPKEVVFLIGDGSGRRVPARRVTRQPFTITAISPAQAAEQGIRVDSQDADRLRSDLTGDGRVTMADISMFLAAWSTGDRIFDFTGDGRMTFRDFSIILADFFENR